jgi:transposase-like protein
VQRLQGEATAKRRLEVILQTLTGALGVQEAAATLGITPQRLHELRAAALQAGVDELTPRPSGRPRQTRTPEQQRIAALEEELERLRRELAASQLRTEIAVLLPGRSEQLEKKRASQAEARGAGRGRSHSRGRPRSGGTAHGERDAHANREDPPGAAGR